MSLFQSLFPLNILILIFYHYSKFSNLQGCLTIKIWKRSTDVDSMNPNSGPPPEQDIPLQVPKKTKLYVEQVENLLDVVWLTHPQIQSLIHALSHSYTHTTTSSLTYLPNNASKHPHTPCLLTHPLPASSHTHSLTSNIYPHPHLASLHAHSLTSNTDAEGERARPWDPPCLPERPVQDEARSL